jgi:hypothetical protein
MSLETFIGAYRRRQEADRDRRAAEDEEENRRLALTNLSFP